MCENEYALGSDLLQRNYSQCFVFRNFVNYVLACRIKMKRCSHCQQSSGFISDFTKQSRWVVLNSNSIALLYANQSVC